MLCQEVLEVQTPQVVVHDRQDADGFGLELKLVLYIAHDLPYSTVRYIEWQVLMSKKRINTLAAYEQEHRRLARRLSRIGFLWAGSITQRYLKCGNSRCACATDADARHGPYIYWSTKKAGKTVSRKLSPEEAKLLGEWVANRQELNQIVNQMMSVSQKAFDLAMSEKPK